MKHWNWFRWMWVGVLAGVLQASALPQAWEGDVTDAILIDGGSATNVFPSTRETTKLVLNPSTNTYEDGTFIPDSANQSRILMRLPEGVFEAFDEELLEQSRVNLTLTGSGSQKNYDGRSLELHPLTAAYDPANTTWERAGETAWTNPGGDFMEEYVTAIYTNGAVTWDILPLLQNAAAATNLATYGAMVQFNQTNGMARFMQVTFGSLANTNADVWPVTVWVEIDPFSDVRDFAVSYIDSRDANDVYWEQGISTVGKIVLNGADGSECRAILSMPESLAAIPPGRVQSVVAKFDAEIQGWTGEQIFLYPIATPTLLERHPNNHTSPVHGPSWNSADASVDTNANTFVVGDGTNAVTYTNAAWNTSGGDWMESMCVTGVVVQGAGTAGTATFDLTPLWHDDEARAALMTNGAICRMDPAGWPAVRAEERSACVNLYRPDDCVVNTRSKYSWMRVTEYEQVAGGADEMALPVVFRIDSASPDASYFGQSSAKLVLNFGDDSETRALCTLPTDMLNLDLPAYESFFLRFNGGCRDGGETIPVLLHAATQPFGITATHCTTWNSAQTNTETFAATAWTNAGGDCSAFAITGSYDTVSGDLTFDIASLMADAEAWLLAQSNGLIIRFDPNQTVVEAGMPRLTLAASGAVVAEQKPLATTYIDNGNPDANYSSGIKTLAVLNSASSGGEARILAKLSADLLNVDLTQTESVHLLISFFRRWTGDDGVNPVALHPAATAFRLDQATWNQARDGTPWTAPGGDFLEPCVTASDNSTDQLLTFDLAPLLADETARAALAENGALIRMLGDAPEYANNNGYNINGSNSSDVPVVVLTPAGLELARISTASNGSFNFSVKGMSSLYSYELLYCDDLAAQNWVWVQDVPADGSIAVMPTEQHGFYRIQAKE